MFPSTVSAARYHPFTVFCYTKKKDPATPRRRTQRHQEEGPSDTMKKGSAERYGQKVEDKESEMIAEGVESLVEYKGEMKKYLKQLEGGVKGRGRRGAGEGGGGGRYNHC